ncbi:transferase activity, transferring phosphorus-containing groups [Nesidiocoris tenuis]|uniref:Transferase activity, transferring phosphorus-containing groups n=1 Tax=Nesidiocoris tenuis TaxID=355587 RepID=A0ABN7AW71_9HEMI|nr:transferase activity, transferring phosphorus-containing groups [Nesidiocoris tenuis]
MDKEWLETVMKRHDKDRSVCRVISAEYEPAVQKGENWSSIVLRAKFRVVLGSGRETTKFAIIKKIVEIEEQAKLLSDLAVFKVETKIFTEVIFHMRRLMDEYQDRGDILWCELIGYNPYDTIILEDLNHENFRVANRKDNLDLAHSLLVLKSLGRFHAMSRVLLNRGLISSDDLKPMYMTSDSTYTSHVIKGGLTQASQVMASSWPLEWKDASDRIASDVEGSVRRLQELAKITDETFVVLNHGDTWNCNLMFKYSPLNETEPIALRFIDFQLCHYNSYAFDIVYFIYSSMKPDERRSNIELFFETYHQSLISTLEFYGHSDGAPTLDDVRSEVERLEYFAFVVLTCVYPVVSADRTDAFDMDKISHETDYSTAYNPEIFKTDQYMDAVCEELRTYIGSGVI